MTAAQVKELSPPTFHFAALFYSLTQAVVVCLTLQQASKTLFSQPLSVSSYNLPKLITKLKEGKACSETSFVPIYEDLARKGSLPQEAS